MKNPVPPVVIALIAALGLFMAVLDSTVVNVILAPLQVAFKADLPSVQWVVSAYALAQASVIPVTGYLSGRFGLKNMFLLVLLLFGVSSALCGLARSLEMLIAARVFQGLTGGALIPLAQSISFGAYPAALRSRASAITGVPVLLAPAFGPTLGGWLAVHYGWPMVFLINLPVGLLACVLALRYLPADAHNRKDEAPAPLDWQGLLLCCAGVVTLIAGLTLASEGRPGTVGPGHPRGELYGWGDWRVALLSLSGLALLAWYVRRSLVPGGRGSQNPVLNLRLLQRKDFFLCSLVSWMSGAIFFGSILLIPVFLQQIRHPALDAFGSGLALMPQGVAAGLAVASSSLLYQRLGPRVLATCGSAFLAISCVAMSFTPADADGRWLLPWLVLRGLGFGYTYITVLTRSLEGVGRSELPQATSLINTTRQIAMSIGLALSITFFVQRLEGHLASAGSSDLIQAQSLAGVLAFNEVFAVLAVAACVMALVATRLPLHRKAKES